MAESAAMRTSTERARIRLDDAMRAQGSPPPCAAAVLAGQHDLWFSEDQDERDAAVDACLDCPVFMACTAYANTLPRGYEGIIAGRDLTMVPRRTRPRCVLCDGTWSSHQVRNDCGQYVADFDQLESLTDPRSTL